MPKKIGDKAEYPTPEEMNKLLDVVSGDFRVDARGNIEYYVGWRALDYKEIEDLKKALRESYKRFNSKRTSIPKYT